MSKVEVLPLGDTTSWDLVSKINSRETLSLPVSAARDVTTYGAVLVIDGQPIGAMGLVMPWLGVAEVWAIVGTETPEYKFTAVKAAKRFLDTAQKVFGLRWLTAHVKIEDTPAVKTALMFGLKALAVLPEYGPNKENYHFMGKRLA